MSQIPRITIEENLQKKGFEEGEEEHHRYFHHVYKGKRTGAYTYTSRGSGFKVYGDELLGKMAKQLRLKKLKEVKDLLNCPMTQEMYIEKLKEYGMRLE